MKKLPLNIFALLFAVYVIASCCRTPSCADLQRADAVMEEHPDSALAILRGIDPASLQACGEKALYSLLLTQAEVKCDVAITDSARISMAVGYFSEHGPARYKMRAYFYEGVAMYYLSECQKSVSDALQAYDIAAEFGDHYWQAKAAELIADNYTKNFNSYGALPYDEKAIEHYKLSGKYLNHLYSICDYAIDYGAAVDRRRAEEIVDSIYDIAQNELCDSMLMAYCLHAQIYNAIALEKFSRVLKICDQLRSFNDDSRLTSHYYYAQGMAHLHNGNYSKASDAIEEIKHNYTYRFDSVNILHAQASYAEAIEDYKEAFVNTKNLLDFEEAEMKRVFEKSITATHRDYFSRRMLDEKKKNHTTRIVTLVSICVLLVVAALVSAIVIMRFRYKKSEIERKMAEISDLSAQICRRKEENDQLSRKIAKHEGDITDLAQLVDEQKRESVEYIAGLNDQFRERWDMINMLCNEFYETRESKISKSLVLDKIERELVKIKSDDQIRRMEHTVDRLHDNIIAKIRRQCVFLKESDIRLITMIFAGLSFRAICLLLDMSRTNFYQKRLRLIARIQKSEAPDKDLFIESIKKSMS